MMFNGQGPMTLSGCQVPPSRWGRKEIECSIITIHNAYLPTSSLWHCVPVILTYLIFCIAFYQIPVVYHSPGVGQNLQDHIAAYGLTWLTGASSAGAAYNPFVYTTDPKTYWDWKMTRTGQSRHKEKCLGEAIALTWKMTTHRNR